MKTKYIWLLAGLIGFTACQNDDDASATITPAPALTAGTADFSKFVSVGNSLTAGFSDGALYKIAQENSMPSIMAQQFALAGGGSFSQPLMNDNTGGLLLGGTQITPNRFVFNGSGPAPLETVIGPVTPTTDLLVNNPTGPFNNMGVPGAKSFHLLAPGYGNIGNLSAGLANPYYVRMTGTTPDASMLEMTMAQAPSFFSLWIGNNDVLGYALTGGDGSDPITPTAMFDGAYGALVGTLTSGGAKGVAANIPYVTTIPHFTTVPYDAVPLDAATAAQLNAAYAAYNGGLQFVVDNTPFLTQEEADKRMISFSAGQNPVVMLDENLTDLTGVNPALINMRQATANDLLVLPAANFIGTLAVPGNPATANGVAVPLGDKWVLTPEEQEEIKTATDVFNATIQSTVTSAGLAFFDANSLMQQLANGGVPSGSYILTADLVTGGGFSLDGVHPTSRGYALMANEMLKAIDIAYGSNFAASENLVDISNYNTNYSPLLQ